MKELTQWEIAALAQGLQYLKVYGAANQRDLNDLIGVMDKADSVVVKEFDEPEIEK